MNPVVEAMKPLIERAVTWGALVVRPMSLGVRAVIADGEGGVFLVKHSYVPGWYLPGGGVDAGETCDAALRREVREEAGFEVEDERLRLFGLYQNARVSRRDHVALYVVERTRKIEPVPYPNREIVEAGFFPLDRLPGDTTRATQARLAEVFAGAAPSEIW